jgi:hypothetical protein
MALQARQSTFVAFSSCIITIIIIVIIIYLFLDAYAKTLNLASFVFQA